MRTWASWPLDDIGVPLMEGARKGSQCPGRADEGWCRQKTQEAWKPQELGQCGGAGQMKQISTRMTSEPVHRGRAARAPLEERTSPSTSRETPGNSHALSVPIIISKMDTILL